MESLEDSRWRRQSESGSAAKTQGPWHSSGIYRRTPHLQSARPPPRSEESMRTGFRRVLSVVAITAVALHSALWGGTATIAAATAVDPFSVICHSGGDVDTAQDQAPTSPLSAPSHACDHCNLCGAAPSPAASPAAVVIRLLTARPSRVFEPVSTIPRAGFEVALKGARGPPVFA